MKRNEEYTIVIAEDSQTQAQQLKHLLITNNYRIYHGNDGKEALNLVKMYKPNLVISDVIMPDMNGYELCRSLKSDESTKHIPLILLTSLDKVTDVLKGLEAGADNYISKPFNDNFLLYRVNKILTEYQNRRSKVNHDYLHVNIGNEEFLLDPDPQKILDFLLSTYETALHTNRTLQKVQDELSLLNESLEEKVEERTEALLNEVKEHKRTTRELEKKGHILNKAQEIAHMGSWEMNVKTGITKWSDEMFRILEYEPGKLAPDLNQFIEAICSEERIKTVKVLENAIKTRSDFEIETRIVCQDDHNKYVLIQGEIETKDDEAFKVIGSLLDITDRKNSELKLQKALAKAEESDSLKTSFLQNLSHEIRTPMNAIMGFSTLMCETEISFEEQQSYTQHIISSATKLLTLIDDIVDAALIETGQTALQPSIVNLNGLLKNIYNEFITTTNGKNPEVNFNLDIDSQMESLYVETVSDKVKQIFKKLLSNSFKFTSEGEISMGYELEGNEAIKFYVTDTGTGIPDDKINIIFKKFTRIIDDYSIKHAGMGIGLSTTKKLVELMNGEIWVESDYGKGSTFFFRLPVTIKPITKDDERQKPFETSRERILQNKHILIAEDVETNYLLVEQVFARTGSRLYWAKNGKEAVELYSTLKQIDLVLLDIQMPVMNGYEAAQKIREIRYNVPIIALTAFALEHDRTDILERGFDELITKPVKPGYLKEVVQNALMQAV